MQSLLQRWSFLILSELALILYPVRTPYSVLRSPQSKDWLFFS